MTSLTFGQLVAKQQMQDPSADAVKAGEYEIPFGKHKGMNLSMLMEQQHSYCMWLINQAESKNKHFNDTCNNIKILIYEDEKIANPLMTVDGVELVEGEPMVINIDPAKPGADSSGVYEIDPVKNEGKIPDGLLMGKISDLLEQVTIGDLSFEFGEADIDVWFKLAKELDNGIDSFVIIQTKISDTSDNQRIKKVIPQVMTLKAKKGVLANA